MGFQDRVDTRHPQHSGQWGTRTHHLERSFGANQVGIQAHQLSEPAAVDPADAAQVQDDFGIVRVGEATREFGEITRPEYQFGGAFEPYRKALLGRWCFYPLCREITESMV